MLRLGIIGSGAIGGTVAQRVQEGSVVGCVLSGIVTRRSSAADLQALLDCSDVVVEAAGHEALAQHGLRVVQAGVDLLVVSVGALVDDALLARLRSAGGGRLLISTGAIGGLDLLKAAALFGPLESVSLESTKRPGVLVRPWMDPDIIRRLEEGREAVEAFSGSAREAARRFPESANVAATLGLATLGLDATRVTMVGDPAAQKVRHRVRATGAAGSYEIIVENNPSPENPRTSAVVPYAVLRALRDLSARTLIGI